MTCNRRSRPMRITLALALAAALPAAAEDVPEGLTMT
jgi:hypothetical protein